MGAFDLLDPSGLRPSRRDAGDDGEAEFSKGLRGGWNTLGAQGQAFAGSAARAVGADEFAANRDAAAQANLDQAGAAESAAQTPSRHGIKDLRTFGNWVGYNAGQLAPSFAAGISAGVLGGLVAGPVGAIAAPTALFTPMEAGDIALRNRTDPEASLRGPQENFIRELGGGAASSLAGNIIPGVVGGKLAGTGAKAAAGRTFRENLGQAAVTNVGGEAVGGGAGEAVKQVASNEGKPLDWDAVGANAAAGAVVGGALTPIGVAGDALHSAPAKAGTTMAGMAKSGLEAVKTKAQEYDPVNRIRDALTPKGDPDLANLAEGKPLDTTNEMAGADGQAINDRTAMEKVSSKLSEMLQDAGLTPELRASAEQTMANMANSPAAVRMGAVLSNSWAKTKDTAANLSTFAKDSLESWKGADAAPADGTKHSDDYSGIRKTLTDTVVPWLQKNSPETLRSEGDMADIGELFRRTMDHTYKSDAPLPLAVKYGLFQHFGGDTLKIMQSMQGAFKSADPDALTRHYEQLNQLRADQKEYTNLTNLIGKATTENGLKVDPAALTAKVLEWASRDPGKRDANDKLAEAKRTFENQSVQDELQRALGKHYESVMKAVEKEATRQQDVQGQKPNLTQKDSDADTRAEPGSEDGAFDAPDGPDEQIVMGGKKRGAKGDGEAVMQSEVFRSRGEQGLDRAAQLLADAKIKYPDHDVSFRSEKELGRGERTDHGYVVAEKIRGADTFTPAEYESLRFDAKNHGGKERKNPARLDADGQIFDATKIERVGAAHMKRNGTPRDDDAGVARNQALMHGIAQLMIEHPTLQVPDTAVVRYVDGKPVTLGEIKSSQLVSKPKGRAKDDLDEMAALADGDTLRKVQERRKAAETALKAAVIDKLTRDGVPAGERREAYMKLMSDPAMRAQHGVDKAALKEAAIKQIEKEGIKDIDAKRARFKEIVNDPAIRESFGLDQADADADAIGKVEYGRQKASDMTTDVLEKSGRTQVSKDGNIHELTATQGDGKNGELRVTANLDGSPRYATTRRLGGKPDEVAQRSIEAVEDRAYELVAGARVGSTETITGKTMVKAGQTMQALIPYMDKMNGMQRAMMASATNPRATPAEILELLQPLRAKYLPADWKPAGPVKYTMGEMKMQGVEPSRGVRGGAEAPKSEAIITLPKKIAEFREYIDNPPADYTTERAQAIGDWAAKQEQRLTEAMKKVDEVAQTDEYDRLNEMKLNARFLKESAHELLQNEKDMAEADKRNGTNLFGGNPDVEVPPSPKAVAAEKAASSGNEASLTRMQHEFPDLTLRQGTTEEQVEITAAHEALNKALGARAPYVSGITVRDGTKSGWAGKAVTRDGEHHILLSKELFDSDTPFLGSVENKAERAILHEVGHLLDRDDGHFSDNSSTFKEGGRVFNELQALAAGNAGAHSWFGYAFNTDRPHRELFAQAFAAYHFDPRTLHDNAPKTYKFFQDYFGHRNEGGSGQAGRINHASVIQEAKLVEAAKNGDPALQKELRAATDPKSLQRAVEAMNGVGKPNEATLNAINIANERITELLRSDDTAAYGMQLEHKYSMERTAGSTMGPAAAEYAADYLERVVPWVKAELDAAIPHAGEFDASGVRDVIRVSVNAFNPESTAYHESMHAFIKDVMAKGDPGVVKVLQDAADSPVVLAQMKQFFKDEIGVLRQLKNDPEERIAVMYQMWAKGDLNLGPAAKGVFQRIADFFKKVIGNWTNEQHAEHIMEYFSSGEYAGDRLTPNAVARATMGKGVDQVYARIRAVTKPLANLSEEVFGSGGANMRDMNVPAMTRIAELMKKRYIDEGGDPGYIPASRMAHTKFANQLVKATRDADEATLHEAVEALQRGEVPTGAEAQRVHGAVRKLTDDLFDYLHGAGVNLKDLGYKQDYFPRVWDPVYLSKNKEAFMDMARNYPDWHDPESTYNSLINSGGAELKVTGQPGMTASKERTLAFISHADAAPFMEKGLMRIMDSYILQATRKGEWARRFGEANQHMEELLEQAKAEGATQAQVKEAKKFVAGVNGTLGDDLNPTMRRLMGDMIVYQNIRLLPLAIFSSIPDSMGLLVRGGTLGDVWNTFKRGVTEIPKGLKGEQISDFQTHMAEDLEVITNASLTHALGTSYTQGLVGDTARKINDTFFKYNLMEQYTQSMRVGATEAALKFLQRHDAGLNVHSNRYMAELGLKKGDIQVVDGRVATRVEEGLTEAQAARVKAAVNQWVDGAILRPDAADKATWMNDPRYILIAHLKQFVYSFQQTIIGRVVHEAQNGNYTPAIALASYVPIMIGADAIKGMLQTGGGVPEWKKNWGAGDYLMNGVERAGLLGVGQIPADALTGNLGSLTGPTLEQFADAVGVLGGRETFKHFALHSLPANALYSNTLGAGKADPLFVE